MELGSLFVLLLLLACPLMMVWMMRGHGGHGSHRAHSRVHAAGESSKTGALDELLRRRDELDDEIAELERAETETKTPASA